MPDTVRRAPGSRSPTEIDRRVGENIRALRIEAGLSLEEMSSRLNISHQQLQKYEIGINRISAGMLAHVASVLGVPIGNLYSGTAMPAPTLPVSVRRRLEAAQRAIAAALNGAD